LSSILLSLPRPPPRCTLFPYTTLFRSQVQAISSAVHSTCGSSQGGHQRSKRSTAGAVHAVAFAARVAALAHTRRSAGRGVGIAEDRKSTRLNSSHRTISYAVFCLKKKK